MTETVRFTWELVKAFRDLSYDLNPLHLDPLYSRRTPYGQPVVYGMCLALYGIARWAQGRIFSLEEIKAQFKKPLYIDEAYDLEVSENDNQVTLRYAKNGSLLTKIVFTYSEDVPQINRIDATSSRPFVPLTETKGHHDLE